MHKFQYPKSFQNSFDRHLFTRKIACGLSCAINFLYWAFTNFLACGRTGVVIYFIVPTILIPKRKGKKLSKASLT